MSLSFSKGKIKVFISSVSLDKEVKLRQQRVLQCLEARQIPHAIGDLANSASDKRELRVLMMGQTKPPPQIFNGNDYCGDYAAFCLALEDEILEKFLKLEEPKAKKANEEKSNHEEVDAQGNEISQGTKSDSSANKETNEKRGSRELGNKLKENKHKDASKEESTKNDKTDKHDDDNDSGDNESSDESTDVESSDESDDKSSDKSTNDESSESTSGDISSEDDSDADASKNKMANQESVTSSYKGKNIEVDKLGKMENIKTKSNAEAMIQKKSSAETQAADKSNKAVITKTPSPPKTSTTKTAQPPPPPPGPPPPPPPPASVPSLKKVDETPPKNPQLPQSLLEDIRSANNKLKLKTSKLTTRPGGASKKLGGTSSVRVAKSPKAMSGDGMPKFSADEIFKGRMALKSKYDRSIPKTATLPSTKSNNSDSKSNATTGNKNASSCKDTQTNNEAQSSLASVLMTSKQKR